MRIQPGPGYNFISSSSGFTLDASDPFPSRDINNVVAHPFKIVNVSIVSNKVRYQVSPGTLNNLVPTIDDYVTSTQVKLDRKTAGVADPPTEELASSNFDSTTKTCYVTLRAGIPTATPYVFPDTDITSNRYPQIIGGNTSYTADSDTYGYLQIGTIAVDDITTPTVVTVTQFVSGSLWADRIKLGTDTANYYYARI
jgi:hypothetical protein